jgi:PilZ domain
MKFEGSLVGRELTPRAARVQVEYDARVRFDGTAVDAMILNVSSKGFRLCAAEELEPGMEVTIECDRLEPVRAQIRWSTGQESGGVFLEAIAL